MTQTLGDNPNEVDLAEDLNQPGGTRASSPSYRFHNRPFYESATAAEYSQLNASDQRDLLRYRRDGFLQFDSGISVSHLDQAADYVRQRCLDTSCSDQPTVKEARVVDAWGDCDAIRAIAQHPEIMRRLQMLYGRRPFPFQTLNFPVGSQQRTHSDGIHFNTVPSRFMCGVWVALEDIKIDSGPLHYYVGSHQLADTPLHETFDGSQNIGAYPALEDYNTCYEDYLQSTLAQESFEKVEVCLNKGQAFIWSAGLCHGGSPVTNPASTRLSQVTHVFFDDCVYYSPRRSHNQIGRLWLRDVRDIQTGKRVEHCFNGHRFTVPTPGPYHIDTACRPISDQPGSGALTTGIVRVKDRLKGKLRSLLASGTTISPRR